jgi:hypothetical protein
MAILVVLSRGHSGSLAIQASTRSTLDSMMDLKVLEALPGVLCAFEGFIR